MILADSSFAVQEGAGGMHGEGFFGGGGKYRKTRKDLWLISTI